MLCWSLKKYLVSSYAIEVMLFSLNIFRSPLLHILSMELQNWNSIRLDLQFKSVSNTLMSDTAFVFEFLSLLYLKFSYFIVIFAKLPFGFVLIMTINFVRFKVLISRRYMVSLILQVSRAKYICMIIHIWWF